MDYRTAPGIIYNMPKRKIYDPELVLRYTSKYFEVSISAIRGNKRTRHNNIMIARQIFCYLAKELCNNKHYRSSYTLSQIGSYAGVDHATVLHSHKTVIKDMASDKQFSRSVFALKQIIVSDNNKDVIVNSIINRMNKIDAENKLLKEVS